MQTDTPGSIPPDLKRKRVLLIEDQPAARLVLLQKLRESGLDVDVAANGQVALEKLRNGAPDAVFMDLLLPFMKGADVIKAFRQDPKFADRPIFVCTSATLMDVWSQRGTKAGATRVFDRAATPVDEIVTEVAEHLAGVRPSRDAASTLPPASPEAKAVGVSSAPFKSNAAGLDQAPQPLSHRSANESASIGSGPQPIPLMKRFLKTLGLGKPHDTPNPSEPSARAPAIPAAPEWSAASQPAQFSGSQAPSTDFSPSLTSGNVLDLAGAGASIPITGDGNAVLTLDESNNILFASAACTAMFGWESATLVGKNLRVLLKDGFEEALKTFLLQHRSGGGNTGSAALRVIVRRKNGQELPASITALMWNSDTTMTRKSDVSPSSWTAVFRDLASGVDSQGQAPAALGQNSPIPAAESKPLAHDFSQLQESHAILKNAHQEVRRQFEAISAEAAVHREELTKRDRERQELSERIQAHEDELNRTRTELKSESDQRQQLERKLQDLMAAKARLEDPSAEKGQGKDDSLSHSGQSREHLEEAKAAVAKAEAALSQKSVQCDQLEAELARLRQDRDGLNGMLTVEQEAAAEFRRRSEELENRLREAVGNLERVKADSDKLSYDRAGLESELRAQLNAATAAAQQAETALKQELQSSERLEQRLQALGDNLKLEQAERSKRFEEELSRHRRALDELNGKLADEHKSAEQATMRAEALESRLRENIAEVASAKSELEHQAAEQRRLESEWREKLYSSEELASQLQVACAEAQERNKHFEEEMARLEEERAHVTVKLTSEQQTAAEARHRVEELEARLRENAAELERVKTELEKASDDQRNKMEQTSLYQMRDVLSSQLAQEQRATAEVGQRAAELEQRLRLNVAELERVQLNRDKHAEEQALVESELSAKLSSMKVVAEAAEAALKAKVAQCGQFETELAALQQLRHELDGKLTREQQAAAESRQRGQELESRLRESAAEVERTKAERDKQAEEHARLESNLHAQLTAAKAAAERAEAGLKEEAARNKGFEERLRVFGNSLKREEAERTSRFEEQLAVLRRERDELNNKFIAEQKACAESKGHNEKTEKQLRGSAAELERVKADRDKRAEEQARLESELREQLKAATAATEAARLQEAERNGQFANELAGLRKERDELHKKFTAEQQGAAQSKREAKEQANRLRETLAELESVKTGQSRNAQERTRVDENLAKLQQEHRELQNKFAAEHQAGGKLRRRIKDLEKNAGDAAGELERVKAKHVEKQADLESGLRAELEAAKAAKDKAEEVLKEKASGWTRLEQELASLQRERHQLQEKFTTEHQAGEKARRRTKELEKQLRESATCFAAAKNELEKRATERGGIESELRAELETAKAAVQKAGADRGEEAVRCARLEDELADLCQMHEQLSGRMATEQQASAEYKQRIEELENRLRESVADLGRTKAALENHAMERGRLESAQPGAAGNGEDLAKELYRVRENEAARAAELTELERRVREGVACLARVTADLERERGERRRVEQRGAALANQLQALHEQLKQYLESEKSTQDRITNLEQELRERNDAIARVSADLQKETAERHLAEEQLRAAGDMSAELRKYLSLFEESKKVFKRAQEELESQLQAKQKTLSEIETKSQKEAGERRQLEDALAAAQRELGERSERSAIEVSRLQSELQVEQIERKRLEGDAVQSRYSSLDSARTGRAMVNSLRKQIQQPVDELMQSTRRLLEVELAEEQKKLVESVLENALLLQSNLDESMATGGGTAGNESRGGMDQARHRNPTSKEDTKDLQP